MHTYVLWAKLDQSDLSVEEFFYFVRLFFLVFPFIIPIFPLTVITAGEVFARVKLSDLLF